MHAYGRTLRQAGDLRLLALPVAGGRDRYCVAAGLEPVATYPTLEQALAAFEASREAPAGAAPRELTAGRGVIDLTAYRRRRPLPVAGAPAGQR